MNKQSLLLHNKGIFCISIDTELLWGRKDLDYSKFINRTKKEREIIKKLLDLFQKYQIPTTWAIVTKMLEKPKEKENVDLWYGKDIVDMIKKYKIHEIASHSHTHPEFTKLSRSEAEGEIKKSKAKSFVFPRNKIKYVEILTKNGFIAYRDIDKSASELLLPRTPPVGTLKLDKGIICIPSSMYFVSARGIRKYIPNGLRFIKTKLGIDKATRQNKIFHLWFHPVDFADKTNDLLSELEKILKYANQKRLEGKLDILTMEQIAYTKII